jgi:hypothetical protein
MSLLASRFCEPRGNLEALLKTLLADTPRAAGFLSVRPLDVFSVLRGTFGTLQRKLYICRERRAQLIPSKAAWQQHGLACDDVCRMPPGII